MLKLLRGGRRDEPLSWAVVWSSLPWGWNPPIILFIVGCLIFTVDGLVALCETGFTFHNTMYASGSLIFEVGCLGFLDFDAKPDAPASSAELGAAAPGSPGGGARRRKQRLPSKETEDFELEAPLPPSAHARAAADSDAQRANGAFDDL